MTTKYATKLPGMKIRYESAAPRILLVDGMNAAHRYRHAQSELRRADGHPSGVVHGFIHMIQHLTEAYRDRLVCIAWETPPEFPVWRYKVYPKYKAARLAKREAFTELERKDHIDFVYQVDSAKHWFKLMGVLQLTLPHYEADDTISFITKAFSNADILIVSTDSDLAQLAEAGRVRILNPITDRMTYATGHNTLMYADKEIASSPRITVLRKAIVGDKGDGIEGLHGVAEKTFDKLFPDQTLDDRPLHTWMLSQRERLASMPKGQQLLASLPTVLRNLILVDLSQGYRDAYLRKHPHDYADLDVHLASSIRRTLAPHLIRELFKSHLAKGIEQGARMDPCTALNFLRTWDMAEGINIQMWRELYTVYEFNRTKTKELYTLYTV